MTVTDIHGAVAAKRMGMTRVVPARELSLEAVSYTHLPDDSPHQNDHVMVP